jgi:hypothetical protein
MLLYGDNPPSGEPTLELVRRPLPADAAPAAKEILERLLGRWGWEASAGPAVACVDAVLGAADGAESVELWAFRRAHQVTVEVHCTGCRSTVAATAPVADERASLWGVRPLPGGEAVWFEFR